jgi:hypothetical protein
MATAVKNRAAVSGIVAAAEVVWAAIVKHNPDVAAQVAVVVASKGKKDVYGYHAPSRWSLGNGTKAKPAEQVAEVLIAAEYLNRPARLIFTTLLHEAVHSANFNCGVKDCSGTGNRYHNRRFATKAEEFGLKVEAVADSRGHSTPDITPATAKLYAKEIAAIGRATKTYRHADSTVVKPKNRSLLKGTCDCDDGVESVRFSKARAEKGVVCVECGQLFTAVGQ